jgi:isocitrate dehydrogenase kinase/phosphatase
MIDIGTHVFVRIPLPDEYFRQYERPAVVTSYEGKSYRGGLDRVVSDYQVKYDEPWKHNDGDYLMVDSIMPEHWLVPANFVIEEDAIEVSI